jgi:hypothetical protein
MREPVGEGFPEGMDQQEKGEGPDCDCESGHRQESPDGESEEARGQVSWKSGSGDEPGAEQDPMAMASQPLFAAREGGGIMEAPGPSKFE